MEARRVQPTGSDPSMVNRTYVDGRVQVSDPQFFLVHWLCNITKIHLVATQQLSTWMLDVEVYPLD